MISFVMGFWSLCLDCCWCAVSFLGLLNRRRHDTAQHLRLESMNHCGPTPTRHNDAYRDANMHCSIFITSTLWMFIQIIYAFVFRYILHIFCQFILLFLDLSVDQKNFSTLPWYNGRTNLGGVRVVTGDPGSARGGAWAPPWYTVPLLYRLLQ